MFVLTVWVVLLNRWQLQLNADALEKVLVEVTQMREASNPNTNCSSNTNT